MRYAVTITDAANAEVLATFNYLYELSPEAADRWLRSIYTAINALGRFAGYAPAREAAVLGLPLLQRVVGSHRIVFSVDESSARVTVHYVRHGARRTAGEPDEPTDP